jgi:arginyl-tRNA synthetase
VPLAERNAMLKQRIHGYLKRAIQFYSLELDTDISEELPQLLNHIKVERPKNPEHGDYAANVSFLAKTLKLAPPAIATGIDAHIPLDGLSTKVIGGFINFTVPNHWLAEQLIDLALSDEPGRNDSMLDQRILLEYVSANPTGPLHIGHGRWAALGDSLKRIWEHCAAEVYTEFYINDAGSQMQKIGRTLWYRLNNKQWSEDEKDNFYPGDYVFELAEKYKIALQATDDVDLKAHWQRITNPERDPFIAEDVDANIDALQLTLFAKQILLSEQKDLLKSMGVEFNEWFSERENIHQQGKITHAINKLIDNKDEKYFEEKDGAEWFLSSKLGDDKDRVLKKSDGTYTYLTADIAYHDDKFSRKDDKGNPKYNRFINIWGADHHGYIPRMKAAVQALGHDPNQLEIILGQLVNLIVDGNKTRMGKRRKMLTLQDVIEDINEAGFNGVDAVRFWMVSKSADTTLDFDVDLAASASSDNPVFYAQYAHARCCSIIRNATEPAGDIETGETREPMLSQLELDQFMFQVQSETWNPLEGGEQPYASLEPLFEQIDDAGYKALKQLILRLDSFDELVQDAARLRAPHLIARYVLDLAADFHSFYNVCRIITDEPKVTKSRLVLIVALRNVFRQALELLGVSAPERM